MEKLQSVLALLVPVLTLALAAAVLLWLRNEKQRRAANGEAETARTALFLKRAEAWLAGALPSLITRAENEWTSPQSGALKKSAVKAELMKLAPAELIACIGESSLDYMIERALDETRELWVQLPGVLNQFAGTEANGDDTAKPAPQPNE